MIEIIGTQMTEYGLIADAVGAAVGAFMVAYTLYVVAKIKHTSDIIDAKEKAMLAGEEFDSWKAEKVEKWYKGYKLALVECILLGFFFGAGAGVLGVHIGWVDGAIEIGALAGIAAILSGFFIDYYIIHPIADNKFLKDVEYPLIQKFLGVVTDAPEDAPEDLKELAQKLRDKGLI